MRVKMEQYFQDNRVYTGACAAGTIAPLPADTLYFQFRCNPAPTATNYTIVATGIGPMVGFVYSIDETNAQRTVALPAGWVMPVANNCWAIKKDGSC